MLGGEESCLLLVPIHRGEEPVWAPAGQQGSVRVGWGLQHLWERWGRPLAALITGQAFPNVSFGAPERSGSRERVPVLQRRKETGGGIWQAASRICQAPSAILPAPSTHPQVQSPLRPGRADPWDL